MARLVVLALLAAPALGFQLSSTPRPASAPPHRPPTMSEWRRRSSHSQKAEAARLDAIARASAEGDVSAIEAEGVARRYGYAPQCVTYGEITPKGFTSLAARLRLCQADIFADLGSGLGRVVLQAAEQFDVAVAVGVEMAPSRHDKAVAALASRQALEPRVQLICGDCAAAELWATDGPLSNLTVAWISSTLFSSDLMELLTQRVEQASSLRVVATLRPFLRCPQGYEEEVPPEPCEMSWTAQLYGGDDIGTPVHVYVRTLDGSQRES